MVLQTKLHIAENLLESKEVIERLVNENIDNKLDHYLEKFNKENAE